MNAVADTIDRRVASSFGKHWFESMAARASATPTRLSHGSQCSRAIRGYETLATRAVEERHSACTRTQQLHSAGLLRSYSRMARTALWEMVWRWAISRMKSPLARSATARRATKLGTGSFKLNGDALNSLWMLPPPASAAESGGRRAVEVGRRPTKHAWTSGVALVSPARLRRARGRASRRASGRWERGWGGRVGSGRGVTGVIGGEACIVLFECFL